MRTLCVLTLLAACGPSSSPRPTPGGSGPIADAPEQVPLEVMDGIKAVFDRRATVVGRCYGQALEAGDLKRGSKGYVTVLTQIETDGRARGSSIGESDLESKALHDCVIERVETADFPKPPVNYQTSHTYRFEEF